MNPSNVRVCRVCLAMDVKMFSLQGSLENNLKLIVGENMISSPYACYDCVHQLNKYHKFRRKCVTSQAVLNNILSANNQIIIAHDIKCIDRIELQLNSNLTICLLPSENIYGSQIGDVYVREEGIDIDLEMLVEEDKTDVSNVEHTSDDYDEDDDLPLKIIAKDSNKNKVNQKHNGIHKKARLKAVDMSERAPHKGNKKPVNEAGLTADEVAMLSDFVVTKLSMEEQLAEVAKRKQTPNYRDSPFKCDQCFKGFLQESTLKNHSIRHDAVSGDISCAVCLCRFSTTRAHALHAARHRKSYACRSCPFRTHHMDQAKKHKQWHAGVTYKCQYCNEVSTKLTSHLSHTRMKHPSKFVCAECGYSFVSARGVKMHRSRMHAGAGGGAATGALDHAQPGRDAERSEKQSQGYELDAGGDSGVYCSPCGVRFAARDAWRRHLVTSALHRHDLGLGCRQCGDTFPTALALRAHRRLHAHNLAARKLVARARYVPRHRRPTAHHAPNPTPRYPAHCEHCEEIIPNRSRHWKHYQRCHKDKKYPHSECNYICEICGKGFQANAFLVYHLRTHSSERLFRCAHAQCAAAFHRRAALLAHAHTHTELRNHKCALCGNRFKTKLALRQHYTRHVGTIPFSCQQCGKAFSRAASLAHHATRLHAHASTCTPTAQIRPAR